MGEEEGSGSNMVKGTLEAATGLVKAIPIYEDAIQPVAKQIGKSLEIVGKAVNAALMPVQGLVWGAENIQGFLKDTLTKKLKDVPPEQIDSPKPNIAGPAIEALRYTGHEESLRDMYANLLASAMDKDTAAGAHPAFVEIIKQLTPDEAKLMGLFMQQRPLQIISVRANQINGDGGLTLAHNVSLFGEQAGVEVMSLVPSYIGNMSRLGLISIYSSESYTDPGMYDELERSEQVQHYIALADATPGRQAFLVRGFVRLTDFGAQFGTVCVLSHTSQPQPDATAGQDL
jgi:hypothetical protein